MIDEDRLKDENAKLREELAAMKAKYQPGMTDLMITPKEIDEFLDNPLVHKNLELLAELETARAYARHERDIGAEEVAQANASLILTLQDDLAEAVDALKPFAKAHQDLLRALVYPNWQWKLPTTDDYETAQAIVEKHK